MSDPIHGGHASRPGRSSGRSGRSSGRSFDLTFVLAIALPLLVGAALFLTTPGFGTAYFHPPTTPPLTHAVVVCPPAFGSGDQVQVASDAAGKVSVGGSPTTVGAGTVTTVPGSSSAGVQVSATGATAPGLLATRSSTSPVAATPCLTPRSDEWFTGVAAGPAHDSIVELANPNDGPAVVDITVIGDAGPISVPALRGVAIAGHATQEIDLGAVMPMQGVLALHASVERGQVAMGVRDRSAQLAGGRSSDDWLAGQIQPAKHNLLLGLPGGSGSHQLTVANGTDQQVTAKLKLVTANAILTPDNAPTLDIAPQSVARVDLSQVLSGSVGAGALGIQVNATGAVTASLRNVIKGDLSITGRNRHIGKTTTAVVPTGTKQLVVGGAKSVGALTVTATDANGKQVLTKRLALEPKQGETLALPSDAVRVRIVPERTRYAGSIVLSAKGGSTVIGMDRMRVTGRVPFVKPGLPR